jgi:hypothetical protein
MTRSKNRTKCKERREHNALLCGGLVVSGHRMQRKNQDKTLVYAKAAKAN